MTGTESDTKGLKAIKPSAINAEYISIDSRPVLTALQFQTRQVIERSHTNTDKLTCITNADRKNDLSVKKCANCGVLKITMMIEYKPDKAIAVIPILSHLVELSFICLTSNQQKQSIANDQRPMV